MKNYIFSLPSLVEIIKVGDDQGITEARAQAAVIGKEFIETLGVVKEATSEDVASLTHWGKGMTDPSDPAVFIGKALASEPMLNGADNLWLGASLGKSITPGYDGKFMFGVGLSALFEAAPSTERNSFWDAGKAPKVTNF